MKEIQERYYIEKSVVKDSKEFNHNIISKNKSVYEVVRVVDGIPLFVEEHLERLVDSCKLIGSDYTVDTEQLTKDIHKLITLNKCYNKNFKIVISGVDTTTPDLYLFFIESNYPTAEDYAMGVSAILYKAERDNPNAKVIHSSFRESIKERLIKNNAYEALLVNQLDEITEGSRSNVFLVKDDALYTSPGKDVLKGITRKRIIDLCDRLKIKVVEEVISVSFLKECDGLFMTGTSPKVLPITSVDNLSFESNILGVVMKVKDAYDSLITEYINSHNIEKKR